MTFLQRPRRSDSIAASHAQPAPLQDGTPWAEALVGQRFDHIALSLDRAGNSLWCHMQPQARPSFTMALMRDIAAMQDGIRSGFAAAPRHAEKPFDYFVFASSVPGIFNLGGDLGYFADCIRRQDRAALTRYAHQAVAVVHGGATAFEAPIVTIALVQGDALGGGLESALSLDVLVAERSARMGLPEVLFNLFPGMGAYSLLTRRIGMLEAEKMIMSGRIYTAAELHDMGVVDVLAEDGQGRAAVEEFVARNGRRFNAQASMLRARRRVHPITLEELRDVVDIWVDACLNLQEGELRKMLRLCAAQDRRLGTGA